MSPATLSPSEMGAVASIKSQKIISTDLKEHYLFSEKWKSKISSCPFLKLKGIVKGITDPTFSSIS